MSRLKDRVVVYPLTKLMPSQSQSCSLGVKTLSVTMSKGVQADSGFIVDKEVRDPFAACM